jgi:hypothetical protein
MTFAVFREKASFRCIIRVVFRAGSCKYSREFLAAAGRALCALKANATRQLREDGLWKYEHSPWADKGSKRRLWNERSVWLACDYVNNQQGGDLPDFD